MFKISSSLTKVSQPFNISNEVLIGSNRVVPPDPPNNAVSRAKDKIYLWVDSNNQPIANPISQPECLCPEECKVCFNNDFFDKEAEKGNKYISVNASTPNLPSIINRSEVIPNQKNCPGPCDPEYVYLEAKTIVHQKTNNKNKTFLLSGFGDIGFSNINGEKPLLYPNIKSSIDLGDPVVNFQNGIVPTSQANNASNLSVFPITETAPAVVQGFGPGCVYNEMQGPIYKYNGNQVDRGMTVNQVYKVKNYLVI